MLTRMVLLTGRTLEKGKLALHTMWHICKTKIKRRQKWWCNKTVSLSPWEIVQRKMEDRRTRIVAKFMVDIKMQHSFFYFSLHTYHNHHHHHHKIMRSLSFYLHYLPLVSSGARNSWMEIGNLMTLPKQEIRKKIILQGILELTNASHFSVQPWNIPDASRIPSQTWLLCF